MGERKMFRFPIVLTEHVFDKVRATDVTLAEFEQLLHTGEVIEERVVADRQLKELVLLLERSRPLTSWSSLTCDSVRNVPDGLRT